tara:strand:- start:428 stop:661 length:234 start_codon:yes stop_codon:yes gene_type:complete
MPDSPMVIEKNCETGEEIIRPMTAEEVAAHQQMVQEAETNRLAREEEAQAKADAKLAAQAKLQALGLTGAEIAAITE